MALLCAPVLRSGRYTQPNLTSRHCPPNVNEHSVHRDLLPIRAKGSEEQSLSCSPGSPASSARRTCSLRSSCVFCNCCSPTDRRVPIDRARRQAHTADDLKLPRRFAKAQAYVAKRHSRAMTAGAQLPRTDSQLTCPADKSPVGSLRNSSRRGRKTENREASRFAVPAHRDTVLPVRDSKKGRNAAASKATTLLLDGIALNIFLYCLPISSDRRSISSNVLGSFALGSD